MAAPGAVLSLERLAESGCSMLHPVQSRRCRTPARAAAARTFAVPPGRRLAATDPAMRTGVDPPEPAPSHVSLNHVVASHARYDAHFDIWIVIQHLVHPGERNFDGPARDDGGSDPFRKPALSPALGQSGHRRKVDGEGFDRRRVRRAVNGCGQRILDGLDLTGEAHEILGGQHAEQPALEMRALAGDLEWHAADPGKRNGFRPCNVTCRPAGRNAQVAAGQPDERPR